MNTHQLSLLHQLRQLFLHSPEPSPYGANTLEKLARIYTRNPMNLLFSLEQCVYEFLSQNPRKKKSSEYALHLREQRKLCYFYGGLQKKTLHRYLEKSMSVPGEFSKNLIYILERRLDVILYRSGFVKNISSAQQLISHKKVFVNNTCITIPSYLATPGDIITVEEKTYTHIQHSVLKDVKTMSTGREIQCTWQKNTDVREKQIHGVILCILNTLCQKTQFTDYTTMGAPYIYIYKKVQGYRDTADILDIYKNMVGSLVSTIPRSRGYGLDTTIFPLYCTKYQKKAFKIQQKPLHLEISYPLLTVIFLYSPQRVQYPFLLDFDLLKRS